ncbi:MAG: hypothetical protein ACI4SS_02040, partial [Clostridia bacterium]
GQLILWKGTGGDNQKWEVEQENGKCYIRSVFSGLYITAKDGWVTQQNKADASVWKLMSLDEINSAFLAGTGNSDGFEKNRRVLENLGIADKGRSYSENSMVTNRDAVKLAVKLITGGGEYAASFTDFADVPATDEDSGYIAQAVILDMIDVKANFYPDNAARADEFVEALLRGLNYRAMAKTSGGYMAVANSKKLLKGVSAFEDNTLTYGQLFKILVNTLSVEIFARDTSVFEMEEKSLIDTRWNIDIYEKADIVDVSYTNKTFSIYCDGETLKFNLPDNYSSVELKGMAADIWYDNDNDEVVNIDFYSGYTVEYGYLTAVNGVEDGRASFNPALVKTVNVNYEKNSTKISSDAVITIDGEPSDGSSVRMVNSYARLVKKNRSVTHMDVYELTEGGLFRSTDGDDIIYLRGEKPNAKISDIQDRDEITVVLNGKISTVSSLPYNALIDFCDNNGKLFIAAYVNTVIGTFEAKGDEGYIIDGDEYCVDNIYGKAYYSKDLGKTYKDDSSYISGYYNSSVAVYLDAAGKIRYIRGDNNSTSFIGVITDINVDVFDDIENISVFSDYSGVMSTQTFKIKLSNKSDIKEEDIVALSKSGNTDNAVYEFRISGGKISRIMELDWLICRDSSKALVSDAVRGSLVDDYGEERVNQLFDDKNIFITGWTMGRDYGLTRIHFFAETPAGDEYTLMCSGFNTRYIMAYDSDENFRPREISWYDYRNTNFDRSFLKVGFRKDNTEKMYPDIVYILSSNKYVAVSTWDVHGIVNKIEEYDDDTFRIELIEPNNYIGTYIIEEEKDLIGSEDGMRPSKGDVVTLKVRGNYEKVYYNIYGEQITEEEAAELEDDGEYVDLREEYQTNGYASVSKVWNMLSEIGKYNNDYSITYIDNVYKIDGNLMYYRDSATGAIQPYYSAGGNLFIMEDPSKYVMYDYSDFKLKRFNNPITLDDISVE